ncbi:MAG: flagellar export chaperone FliS [Deltaproteobacteria bacterium]|nr:flagellar export chaperone FliS [Deltaproteobacteria bacterium]MBQ31500.1 flagellar export chaperone FliS [Deltaproteobacteria bacterium]MDP7318371.1 flagellar export chaperone FliS [SAR324 cluster bacterium]|tara:strand:- start:126 stop:551 length:426 start_codon:yes stop_codon:yes gene_type:complete
MSSYRAYHQTSVQTSDQLTLIVMLYDGMLRYLRKAHTCIEVQDIEGAHNYLMRSKDIVNELLSTLRVEKAGEVGGNLRDLYLYMFRRILEANLNKDPQPVQDVLRIAGTLRQGWLQIKSQRSQHKQATLAQQKRAKFRAQG